jgi:hypothetical protein
MASASSRRSTRDRPPLDHRARYWLSEEEVGWRYRAGPPDALAARWRAQHQRDLASARAGRRRNLLLLAACLLGVPSLAASAQTGVFEEEHETRPFVVPKSFATADWGDQGAGPEPPAALRDIARCESRGEPTAVSADGVYRGKYQFDLATWTDLGGTGDPAATAEHHQDRLAMRLYRQRGEAPWPVCGA